MKQKIRTENPTWSEEEVDEKMDKICTVYDEALAVGFITDQYLPMPLAEGFIDDDGPFDRESIMLYSSRRNGKPTPFGKPGKVLVVRDTGEEFHEADKPSTKDVEVSLTVSYSHPLPFQCDFMLCERRSASVVRRAGVRIDKLLCYHKLWIDGIIID